MAAVLIVIHIEVPTAPGQVTEVKVTYRTPSMHQSQSAQTTKISSVGMLGLFFFMGPLYLLVIGGNEGGTCCLLTGWLPLIFCSCF